MKWRTVCACAVLISTCVGGHETYQEQALRLLSESPLVDTHVDLPQIIRSLGRQPLDLIPQIAKSFPGHVDIPRMKQGRLGGAFWTVWTPCHDHIAGDTGADFTQQTESLRNAFEMLDIIQQMIKQHPETLQSAYTSDDIRTAHQNGKIASLIGLEGTHFLGNSLGVLRIFAQLGVRYVTLTHVCHSAFASSAGAGAPLTQIHAGNGLTALGRQLVAELNRLGILVDVSHTSDATAREAITLSKAPVVWTHSGSRAVWDHPRNVPDDVLALIGDGPDQKDGLVQSVFYPPFIGPHDGANLTRVADHIEYISRRIGRNRVGIASDFDGMYAAVEGLEDASKYPGLVAEMLARGWSEPEVKGLIGGNLMRIMDAVDRVKEDLQHELPSSAVWENRVDLPSTHWGGGPEQPYFPTQVRRLIEERIRHDEL